MAWKEVMRAFKDLQEVRLSGEGVEENWGAFRRAVEESAADPPAHLNSALETLAEMDRPREEIAILDQGCGTGVQLLYLLALGYTNIYGVDLGPGSAAWNRHLPLFGGPDEPRFMALKEGRVPLPDQSIDLLISQQVAEHVSPDAFEDYYAEAGRLLKPGGIALHQVPHRLSPFDSHMRTWFVHMLPRPIALRLYSALGRNREFAETRLFLRWPWVHYAMTRRHVGATQNLTPERLQRRYATDSYEGPRRLRSFVGALTRAPVFGPAISNVVGALAMVESKARRG